MIVDVHFDDDTVQIARIDREENDMYVVNFLEKSNNIYNFSINLEAVPKESISGFYDVDDLVDTGLYVKVPGGYDLVDDSEDEDYVCSDEDDDSDSESLVDEDDDEA
jgi:hypothetical protein